jgi:glycosyltransferase involved in cell wall biosynthesis
MQRNLSGRVLWKHPHKFKERTTIHFPYDTIPQLSHFHPDVIVSCEMGLRTLQAAMYRRASQHSRLVVWATVSEVTEQGRSRLRRWLRTWILRNAEVVVVNGQSGARYIQRFGVEPDRLFFVPYTTELQPFLAIPATRTPKVRHRLVYSGALSERKGLPEFLIHLANWAEQHPDRLIEIDIAGDGPLKTQIAGFPRPANLQFRLLGHIAYDQLPQVYRHAGILVFPTLADEWGLVVTEAMASGVPVLGSLYSQAVDELVTDEENGWKFRPDCSSEVCSALHRALDTPVETVNDMGENARARVRNLTPSAMADRIMAAIECARAMRC